MPIQFQTEAQKNIYEKVVAYTKELFGEMARFKEDAPVFLLDMGSAFVRVAVFPWGDDDAFINARSWVICGAEVVPELMHFLLRQNDDMRFGAFGMDSDNDIFFEYSVVGSTLDKPELKACVLAVLMTADRYDDQIQQRWGGTRACDRTK
jgi:hypothetical protein